MSRRTRILLAIAVFALSFGIRSLYAVDLAPFMYSHRQPGTRMAGRYDEAALSILRGDGILFPARPNPSDTGLLARPPGYSVFLSAIYSLLGRSFFAAQLVQNAINSISPVLLFLLAGRLVSWRVGTVAGLLAAVSPHLSYTSNLILPDAFCALPILLGTLLLASALSEGEGLLRRALWSSALAGALLGLAAWMRPNVMLLPPCLAAFLVIAGKRRRRVPARAGLLVLMAAVVISPITIRNYWVYGELVPISINGGITLWQGVAAAGGQRFGAWARDKLVIEDEAAQYGNERYAEWWASPDGIRRDRERYRKAMAIIARHPLWYARAMVGRMVEMIDYGRTGPSVMVSGNATPLSVGSEPGGEDAPGVDQGGPEPQLPSAIGTRKLPRISKQACLAVGESLGWTRALVRTLQQTAVDTTLPFILCGLAVVFALSWRKGLFLVVVPLYYFLFGSMFILEWRVVTPMHYYLFVFAAATWVVLATLVKSGLLALAAPLSRRKGRSPTRPVPAESGPD